MAYNPWSDLGGRGGAVVRVLPGRLDDTGNLGVTDFATLTITLDPYMDFIQQRSTLAHELIHLERGPSGIVEDRAEEERVVELLTATRLVDPVVYDTLPVEALDASEGDERVLELLGVDRPILTTYADWRGGVSRDTAVSVWDERRRYSRIVWPPTWLPAELAAARDVRLLD